MAFGSEAAHFVDESIKVTSLTFDDCECFTQKIAVLQTGKSLNIRRISVGIRVIHRTKADLVSDSDSFREFILSDATLQQLIKMCFISIALNVNNLAQKSQASAISRT